MLTKSGVDKLTLSPRAAQGNWVSPPMAPVLTQADLRTLGTSSGCPDLGSTPGYAWTSCSCLAWAWAARLSWPCILGMTLQPALKNNIFHGQECWELGAATAARRPTGGGGPQGTMVGRGWPAGDRVVGAECAGRAGLVERCAQSGGSDVTWAGVSFSPFLTVYVRGNGMGTGRDRHRPGSTAHLRSPSLCPTARGFLDWVCSQQKGCVLQGWGPSVCVRETVCLCSKYKKKRSMATSAAEAGQLRPCQVPSARHKGLRRLWEEQR